MDFSIIRGILQAKGYSEETADAKIAQDIVLKAIADSGFHDNLTIKGGVVMSGITGLVRRSTTICEVDICGKPATLCHYPMLIYPQARRGYMIYGHIHNNVRDDYWPLIARRSRMFNAGVDVNNFEPVTFDEMVDNNHSFISSHAEDAKKNPFDLNCIEA